MNNRSAVRLERQGHAVLDVESRTFKAAKIEKLLELDDRSGEIRLLEIGTGSGGIASYFANHPSGRFRVYAVDVEDTRLVKDGYQFSIVRDATLPFADNFFDVVLSNHVIEHVGDEEEQLQHLREFRRVLNDDGRGYLAVPNRWMLVEPHFRLAFLSWLPERLRTPYLRFSGKGLNYDCRPLTLPVATRLLTNAGLAFQQQCGNALKLTYELERPSAAVYRLGLSRVPDSVYSLFRAVFPTLIFKVRANNS